MSVFGIFMICWCAGLVLFPTASVISSENLLEGKFKKEKIVREVPEKEEKTLESVKAEPVIEKQEKKKEEKKPEKKAEKKVEKSSENAVEKPAKKVEPPKNEAPVYETEKVSGSLVFDDFNGKELFSTSEDLSGQQIIEHDGKMYLLYHDRNENGTAYMGARALN